MKSLIAFTFVFAATATAGASETAFKKLRWLYDSAQERAVFANFDHIRGKTTWSCAKVSAADPNNLQMVTPLKRFDYIEQYGQISAGPLFPPSADRMQTALVSGDLVGASDSELHRIAKTQIVKNIDNDLIIGVQYQPGIPTPEDFIRRHDRLIVIKNLEKSGWPDETVAYTYCWKRN